MMHESLCGLAVIENISQRFGEPFGRRGDPTLTPVFFAKFLLWEGRQGGEKPQTYCMIEGFQGGQNEKKSVDRVRALTSEPVANFTLKAMVAYARHMGIRRIGMIKADENPYFEDRRDRDAMRGLYGLAAKSAGFKRIPGSRYNWIIG
jgi:hypothetical protein